MKKIIISFSVFIGLLILMFLLFFITMLAPVKEFKNKYAVVRKGESFNQIYDDLGIKYTITDKIYLKITGNGAKARVGSYKFNGKVSRMEIINKIVSGKSDEIRLTIPEGFSNRQVFERIEKLGLGSKEKIEQALKRS